MLKVPSARYEAWMHAAQGKLLLVSSEVFFFFDMIESVTSEVIGSKGILKVNGPMADQPIWGEASYDDIASKFADLQGNSKVKTIEVSMETPGGTFSGAEGCCAALRDAMREHGKPVTVSTRHQNTSGGMWLTAALYAEGAECNFAPDAVVGSVGVISLRYDVTEAYKNDGINISTFTSHYKKAWGRSTTPMTQEEKDFREKDIKIAGDTFVNYLHESKFADKTFWDNVQGLCISGKELQAKLRRPIVSEQQIKALGDQLSALLEGQKTLVEELKSQKEAFSNYKEQQVAAAKAEAEKAEAEKSAAAKAAAKPGKSLLPMKAGAQGPTHEYITAKEAAAMTDDELLAVLNTRGPKAFRCEGE